MRAPCSIEGCAKSSRGRGWCATHWLRWRKYGDPLYVTPRAEYRVVKHVGCDVLDCDRAHHAGGYCGRHYIRLITYGDPLAPPRKPSGRPLMGDKPTYAGIHRRLARTRGRASLEPCVDCDKRANEWSYDGGDAGEYQAPVRTRQGTLPVTENLDAYSPRCRPCHRRRDRSLDRCRNDLGQWASTAPRDDSQVVDVHAMKHYADGIQPGARITVTSMETA